MRHRPIVITLVAAAIWSGANVSAGEPDYRGYVEQCVPRPATFKPRPDATFGDDYAASASVYMYLWRWTGRTEYRDAALQLVEAVTNHWDPGNDFFTLYPLLDTYQKLDQAGVVSRSLQGDVRAMVEREYRPSQRGNNNQTACRIAGVALAIKLFPDLTEAGSWSEYVQAGWNDWYPTHDTIENAPNYNRIFWDRMFHLSDMMGWNDQLRDPRVHETWLRYRDEVTPGGGFMPGFGDSNPWHRDAMWIADFERAAALYQDPTLRWAAFRMWPLEKPDPAHYLPANFRNIGLLLSLCYADEWRDTRLKPAAPDVKAAVLTRRTPDSDRVIDSIVLAPSREPTAPFAMVELFATQGGHAHPEWGALQFFEADSVPFLHGLGYNNRLPDHGNIVLMNDADEAFPHKLQPFEADVWYEATIPLKEFWSRDKLPVAAADSADSVLANPSPSAGADLNVKHFDSLSFRVENGGQRPIPNIPPIEFWAANVRLSGPGGSMLLEDFRARDALKHWAGAKNVTIAPNALDGQPAMQMSCPGGAIVIGRAFNLTWDERRYDSVKFNWKLSSTRSMLARPLILRLSDRGRNWDYHVEARGFTPTVTDARAETRDGDSFGQTTLIQYFTDDSTLKRQLLLTRDGVLVVRDTLTAGKLADGQVAGPIWNLDGPPEHLANWYDAPAENPQGTSAERLLVYLGEQSGRTLGVQQVQLWECEPYTVFARQELKADEPVVFVTVLVPHAAEETASSLAKGIAITQSPMMSRVRIVGPRGSVEISISDDGTWLVRR